MCHCLNTDLIGNNQSNYPGQVQMNSFKNFISTLIQLESENDDP